MVMTRTRLDRRSLLKATGVTLVGAMAGCGGGGDDSGSNGNSVPDRIDSFLSGSPDVGNYDGTWDDLTGQDQIVVDVGAPGNGTNQAFAPVAFKASTGTTIEWQWTGQGGLHNVVSVDDSDFQFDSGQAKTSRDPFTQTFDGTGIGLYVCEPHQAIGMKGAFQIV